LALAALILAGFILRIFASSDSFLHEWDERYHALVAKHLMNNFLKPTLYATPLFPYDYKNWTTNHIWLHKQPLALWLMTISLDVFGIHAWAVRVPSIILSTIGIKLCFDISKILYSKEVAFIAAFLFSIHGSIIELAAGRAPTDHIDVVFLFFVLSSIWSCVKYLQTSSFFYVLLTGVFLGSALLTKWLPALIILPLSFYILYFIKLEKLSKVVFNIVIISVVAATIFLPWQIYILHTYPIEAKWEYAFNQKHLYVALENHSGNAFYYVNRLRIEYGELIYIGLLFFLHKLYKEKSKNNILVLIWLMLPYMFFSIAATKMASYTIICAPAIFIITANIFCDIKTLALLKNKKILFKLIALLLIALPIRYTIERLKFFTQQVSPEWNNDIQLVKNSKYDDVLYTIINCSHPIELMFSTHCIAYENRPAAINTTANKHMVDYTAIVAELKDKKK
jgi:4-amino-4-deoxy-L-arabinose transferase-like glycosyltransferase